MQRGQPSPFNPPTSTILEGFDDERFTFDDRTVRMAFIRKVYSILTLQITVTAGIVALFTFHEGVREFVLQRPSLYWVAVITSIVAILMLACCGNLQRMFPCNLICLGIFTLAEGFVLGMISVRFSQETIFFAVVITAVITAGLTLFAFQTTCDFTVFGGALCVGIIVLFVFSIICLIFPSKMFMLVISCVGALLFSMYIVYDTQMMIGGDHKYSISPEDYVFATLNLYLDIVMLFTYILYILGILSDD